MSFLINASKPHRLSSDPLLWTQFRIQFDVFLHFTLRVYVLKHLRLYSLIRFTICSQHIVFLVFFDSLTTVYLPQSHIRLLYFLKNLSLPLHQFLRNTFSLLHTLICIHIDRYGNYVNDIYTLSMVLLLHLLSILYYTYNRFLITPSVNFLVHVRMQF